METMMMMMMSSNEFLVMTTLVIGFGVFIVAGYYHQHPPRKR